MDSGKRRIVLILIFLLVLSISAISVESKIVKKVEKEKKSNINKDTEKSTKVIGQKKVIRKNSLFSGLLIFPQITNREIITLPEQPSTVSNNQVPITENLVDSDPLPSNSNKILLEKAPDRGDSLSGNYLINPSPNKLLLKSRQVIPKQKIYSDVKSAIESEKHILIQLNHIPTTAEKEQLKSDGINLLYYIPEKAWIASISVPISNLEQKSEITFIDRLFPADRIDPNILSQGIADWSKNPDGTANLTVLFFDDVSKSDARAVIEKYGIVLTEPAYKGRNLWLVKISENRLAELLNEDSLAYVENGPANIEENQNGLSEKNAKISDQKISKKNSNPSIENSPPPINPLVDKARIATHVDEIQAPAYNLDGTGIVTALLDEGDVSHIDFNSRKIVITARPVSRFATPQAGLMVGDGFNSVTKGGAPGDRRGVATKSTIRVYDYLGTSAEHAAKLDDAVVNGAVVSLNTRSESVLGCEFFGIYTLGVSDYDNYVNGGLPSSKKINIVARAGNSQQDGGSCGSPYHTIPDDGFGQNAKNTITVGAVFSDVMDSWQYTSFGPTKDGRLKPEIVAPSCNDGGISGGAPACLFLNTTTSVTQDDYNTVGYGSKASAAIVSGIIALMYQDWRTVSHVGEPDPVPSTVKAILAHTATDRNLTGPDFATGYGMVNAKGAIDLMRADSPSNRIIHNNVEILNTGDSKTYKINVPPGMTKLKITLSWDDVPGAPYNLYELVNDLDLVVLEPNGITQHYPWTLDNSSPASPAVGDIGGSENHIDNIEQVAVNNPVSGEWTVTVQGTAVPVAPEYFSLITTVSPAAPQMKKAILTGANFENVELTWGASYDESLVDGTVKYKIYRAQSYNGSYDFIGEVLTSGQPYYTYTDPAKGNLDPNTYYYVVRSVDASGNSNWNGQIAGKFAKLLSNPTEFISVPFVQYDESPNIVLQTTNFGTARYYDASDSADQWKAYYYFKTSKGDLKKINHSLGVWIRDGSIVGNYLTVAGVVPPQTQIPLYNGYNMIGFPSVAPRTTNDVLSGISYKTIEVFDPTASPYYLKYLSFPWILRTGDAYWIYTDSATVQTLTIDNPIPWFAVFNG